MRKTTITTTTAAARSAAAPDTGTTPTKMTVDGLSIRTTSCFVTQPAPVHRKYDTLAWRELLRKGKRALEAARDATAGGPPPVTVRLVPPLLDARITLAASRQEVARIARDEFDLREDVATELNRYAREVFGTAVPAPEVFIGGYGASAHAVAPRAFSAFLDTLVECLPGSRWQFAVALLRSSEASADPAAVQRTAEAIAALGSAGGRFAALFGAAPYTPFFPCANHVGRLEGVAVGMSGPSALRRALRARRPNVSIEDVIARTQRDALMASAAIGIRMADRLDMEFLGCDPSQAPVFEAEAPGANSIGATIEDVSGVPLGAPGTKDGFFRLMAALQRGAVASGSRLCGFLNGSFLPISEDDRIAQRVAEGHLTYSGILSLSHVCAAGLDMAVVEPGTTAATIARVLGDVAVTQELKGRALAARLIVPERGTPTDENGYYVLGGLLGRAPALPLDPESAL